MYTPMFALFVKVPLLSMGRKWVYWHQMTVTENTDCWAQEKEGRGKVDLHKRGKKAVLSAIITFLPKGAGWGEET